MGHSGHLERSLLKGSWDLVARAIIRVTILIAPIQVLITLLAKSHDPPSMFPALLLSCLPATCTSAHRHGEHSSLVPPTGHLRGAERAVYCTASEKTACKISEAGGGAGWAAGPSRRAEFLAVGDAEKCLLS